MKAVSFAQLEEAVTSSAAEILKDAAEQSETGTELAENIEAVGVQHEDPEVAQVLAETAEDIREVVGDKTTKVFGGNQAGQAIQGAEGSSEIDVTSTIDGDAEAGEPLLNKVALNDVVEHEKEHEVQAPEWDVESVKVGDKELNRLNVSETGAMSVQETLDNVSDDYRGMFADVTSMVSAEEARDAAREGNLLDLARKAGATEEELAAAQQPELALAA